MDINDQRDYAEEAANLALMEEEDPSESDFYREMDGDAFAEEILSDLPEWMIY